MRQVVAPTRPSARGTVLRSALIFTPFLAVTLGFVGVIVQAMVDDGVSTGRVIGLILVGSVAVLLAFQLVQSLRDLFSQPVETIGLVERRWSRRDFFLFRNDYLFVGRIVYRVQPEEFLEAGLGDTVRIMHYPHTSAVASVEVLERAGQQEPASDE